MLRTGWKEVRRALRGFEGLLATVATASLVVALLEGATLGLLVPLLEAFRSQAAGRLVQLSVGVTLLVLARAGAGYGRELLAIRLQLRVLLGLRLRLAAAFYASRFEDLATLGPGRMVNLFSVQTERVAAGLSSLLTCANAALLLVVYSAALVLLSWQLSLAAGLLLACGAGVLVYARRRILEHAAGMVRAEEESSGLASDDAAGLAVIHAYGAGPQRLALHDRANAAVFRETMALHRWRSAVRPLSEVIYVVVLLAAMVVALLTAPARLFQSAPVILAFAFVLHRFQGQLTSLLDGLSGLAEQEGAAGNVFAFVSGPEVVQALGGVAPARTVERIDLEQVSFAYREGEPVLRNLDLTVCRGEVLAVVGESGAGKSTLVQLLARLRQAGSGRILVDGTPIDRIGADELLRSVGVVFEDGFVFDESIEWNISLGRDLPAGAIREATRVAALDEVLDQLPQGYAMRPGPRGATLSAGQRQRVALARALAGGPQVLILDEATSALDGATEQAITTELRLLRADRITLVIAHRLSTVLTADRIAVLDGGRIVATGTHAELLETSAVYRRLVETQLVDESRSSPSPVG